MFAEAKFINQEGFFMVHMLVSLVGYKPEDASIKRTGYMKSTKSSFKANRSV